MAAANYDDVLDQLRSAGLIVEQLEVGTSKPRRCKVEGDREKRGWYLLHELQLSGGDVLIVGSYGVWHGNDQGTRKIELRKREISDDQRAALKKRLAEDRRQAELERAKEARRASERAAKIWARLELDGDSPYLAAKLVQALGLRFTPNGSAVLPITDATGRIHGLQFLRTPAQADKAKRPAKEFWPAGVAKKGHFHLVGAPQHLVLVAEGYATGASLHMATGYPVAIAFDAGNLQPVAEALRKRYRWARILVCADDDAFATCAECKARVHLVADPVTCPSCAKPHRRVNAGVDAATSTSLAVSSTAWLTPRFTDEAARLDLHTARGVKLTDFNDLHAAEGLHVVRAQLEARILELAWDRPSRGGTSTMSGEGGDAKLRPIDSFDELLKRFALVYGQGGTVFDRHEHCLLSISDMRDACVRRDLHRFWAESPDRAIVRVAEVGFDPACTDPAITCNLWAGWPTKAKAGKCDKLLELLRYMCSAERDPQALYQWVLRWIAYPMQHPGAKMRTTVVVHGPQGTGKNMFFEAVLAIYGAYGRIIDQAAIEDRFNSWASRKLFLIADEVVARSDLYHVKNKLKSFITGDRIRINPKNMAEYEEANHVNLVFLSNEAMPVVLEEGDRRHCIIWTPEKLQPEFYAGVLAELNNGGIAALHDFLLNLDLGEFDQGTLPPLSDAKAKLVDLSLDSTSRWFYAWQRYELEPIGYGPCLSLHAYEAYRIWCTRQGLRIAPLPKLLSALERHHKAECPRKRYLNGGGIKGPHGCVIPPDLSEAESRPDGVSEQTWLGERFDAFANALKDYRGAANG